MQKSATAMILVLTQHLRTKMANNKDMVVGNIQFGSSWDPFLWIDKKINDRVALKMYKALKAAANNLDADSDRKALNKVHKAIQEYEQSYNKN